VVTEEETMKHRKTRTARLKIVAGTDKLLPVHPHFWMEAALGENTIKTLVDSEKIDELVAWWEDGLSKRKSEPEYREASRQVIIEALLTGKHHTSETVAEMVCGALLWMTVKGPIGPTVLPFMRRGDMTIRFEITKVGENAYNFRTKFDEKTDKALSM
jgi:hypothetical protein